MRRKERDFKRIGEIVRTRRLLFGLGTDAVAKMAGIARSTLIRLEAGKPCKEEKMVQIAHVLCLFDDQLDRPSPAEGPFARQGVGDVRWAMPNPKKEYQILAEEEDHPFVDTSDERRRLGTLGFQPFFYANLRSELPGGILTPTLMELHQPTWTVAHYGEEFVYCLRGSLAIKIGDEECYLTSGDSVTFDANHPHQYLPVANSPEGEPPLFLCVMGLRIGREKLFASGKRPKPKLIPPLKEG